MEELAADVLGKGGKGGKVDVMLLLVLVLEAGEENVGSLLGEVNEEDEVEESVEEDDDDDDAFGLTLAGEMGVEACGSDLTSGTAELSEEAILAFG